MILRLWYRFFPAKGPNADFQLGYHTGYWAGVLQGRKDALLDLEDDMASRGKSIGEVDPDDVVRARHRIVH